MSAEVDKLYSETFGADFSKLDADARARADRLVAAASSPSWVIQNGRPVSNPVRKELDAMIAAGALTPKLAQQLGVYASWRMNMMPSAGALSDLTKKKAREWGVPVDKIEKEAGDRKTQVSDWAKGAMNRFAHLVPIDDPSAKKGTKAELKVEAAKTDASPDKLTDPLSSDKPQPVAAAAPAAPGPEGAPAAAPMPMAPPPVEVAQPVNAQPMPINAQPGDLPPMMPQNWQRQQLVNGQYIPME